MEKEIIRKGDFVEVDYTGRIKDGEVFDTTSAEVAKSNDIYNEGSVYEPAIICIGEGHILKALDELLSGKELGKEYKFELTPEKAFGKKNAKLLRLVPISVFRKQDVQPIPGLQVSIDGIMGVIRAVTGGRVIVDFNHPLAGKDVVYEIKAKKLIKDDQEKVSSLLKMELGVKDSEITVEEKKATINTKMKIPEEIQNRFSERAKGLMQLDSVIFITDKV